MPPPGDADNAMHDQHAKAEKQNPFAAYEHLLVVIPNVSWRTSRR